MSRFCVFFTQLVNIVNGNDDVPMLDEFFIDADSRHHAVSMFEERCRVDGIRLVDGSVSVEVVG